jgi:hypothetical protein
LFKDEKNKALFKEYDEDNSGAIDAVEMRRILKAWGITGIDHNSMVEAFMRRDPKVVRTSLFPQLESYWTRTITLALTFPNPNSNLTEP